MYGTLGRDEATIAKSVKGGRARLRKRHPPERLVDLQRWVGGVDVAAGVAQLGTLPPLITHAVFC